MPISAGSPNRGAAPLGVEAGQMLPPGAGTGPQREMRRERLEGIASRRQGEHWAWFPVLGIECQIVSVFQCQVVRFPQDLDQDYFLSTRFMPSHQKPDPENAGAPLNGDGVCRHPPTHPRTPTSGRRCSSQEFRTVLCLGPRAV